MNKLKLSPAVPFLIIIITLVISQISGCGKDETKTIVPPSISFDGSVIIINAGEGKSKGLINDLRSPVKVVVVNNQMVVVSSWRLDRGKDHRTDAGAFTINLNTKEGKELYEKLLNQLTTHGSLMDEHNEKYMEEVTNVKIFMY